MSIKSIFQDIADAIKEKDTSISSLTPSQMPDAIRGISGGITKVYDDYAQVTSDYIDLPFYINADYKITYTFKLDSYVSDQHALGSTGGSTRLHLTQYNNIWYTSSGSSEVNFTGYGLTDKHTFVNNDNGSNYMDGDIVSSYTPITLSSARLQLGRRVSGTMTGRIYEFIIESISTGDILYHLRPCKIMDNDTTILSGLIDDISGEFVSILPTYNETT